MRGLLVALALGAACTPRVVERPVVVTPPPCLTRAAPLPPDGAVPCGARWADYYVELAAWVVETERACGGIEP